LFKKSHKGKNKNLSLRKYGFLIPKTEASNCSYTLFCKPEIVQRKEGMYESGLIILGSERLLTGYLLHLFEEI